MKALLLGVFLALSMSAAAAHNCPAGQHDSATGCVADASTGGAGGAGGDASSESHSGASSHSTAGAGAVAGAVAGGATLNGGSGPRTFVLGVSKNQASTAAMPESCAWVRITQTVDGGWGWDFAPNHATGDSDPSLCVAWEAYREAMRQCWYQSARKIFAKVVLTTAKVVLDVPADLKDEKACPAPAEPPKQDQKPSEQAQPTPTPPTAPTPPASPAAPKADPLKGRVVHYHWCRCKTPPPDYTGYERVTTSPDGTVVREYLFRQVR